MSEIIEVAKTIVFYGLIGSFLYFAISAGLTYENKKYDTHLYIAASLFIFFGLMAFTSPVWK